jgi:hypothetical protein
VCGCEFVRFVLNDDIQIHDDDGADDDDEFHFISSSLFLQLKIIFLERGLCFSRFCSFQSKHISEINE